MPLPWTHHTLLLFCHETEDGSHHTNESTADFVKFHFVPTIVKQENESIIASVANKSTFQVSENWVCDAKQ